MGFFGQAGHMSEQLFNSTRLHELKYPGDAHLGECMLAWDRILDDQENKGCILLSRRTKLF